jgi:hypothetical protein
VLLEDGARYLGCKLPGGGERVAPVLDLGHGFGFCWWGENVSG